MDILNRIPRGWVLLALATLAWFLIVMPFAAFAQEVVMPETVVNFKWGDLLAVFFTNLAANPDSAAWAAFGLVLTWVAARLPGPLLWAFNAFRVEQLLKNAITGGINSTAGAVQGKELNLEVGSSVLAKALQYALDNGNAALIKWMGGAAGVQQKLIARIPAASTVDGGALATLAAEKLGSTTVDGSPPQSIAS